MSVKVPAGAFHGFHHCNFWVGNAVQAAAYYISKYGFQPVCFKNLTTGDRDFATHVVKQGNIFLSFSCPLQPDMDCSTPHSKHQARHGDGVRDVAFSVDDCKAIFDAAVANGSKVVKDLATQKDEFGTMITATIQTYGDTVHTFVQNVDYTGCFMPGFKAVADDYDPIGKILPDTQLEELDHIVGNQPDLEMSPVEEWYKKMLGFHRFWSVDDSMMHTDYSALRSTVMADESEVIKMPINEPAKAKRKSQIQEYVEFYGGAGVQHIAFRTPDILNTIKGLRARGVQFLTIPDQYYVDLKKRLASITDWKIEEDLETIEKLKILVDFDEKGYLLQIFTKPVEDRPTLFIEIIQRHNNTGFGVGNFKALFQSLEGEQAARGNLTAEQ